ncbi:MAG: SpaA isopeptide-forming pilin-related protein [Firmicutes bacterium]|nr:SpaA isopeptide-forming pilin-related protein [Bacillota bacterium]
MKKRNWRSKTLALIMAFVMVFTCTNTSIMAFAGENQSVPVATQSTDDIQGGDNAGDEDGDYNAPVTEDLGRAAAPQADADDDKYYDISKMNPQVTMEYKIAGEWKSQSWVDSHYKSDEHQGIPETTPVRFSVNFTTDVKHTYVPEDQLYYMPLVRDLDWGSFRITTLNGEMPDGLETAGTWNITEANRQYKVLVDLDDNYISGTPHLEGGYVTIEGELRYTPGDSHTMTVPFPGTPGIVVPIKKANDATVNLKMNKTKVNGGGIYKEGNNYYMNYSLQVTNTGDKDATGVIVKDYPGKQDNAPNDKRYNPVNAGDQIYAKDATEKEIITKTDGTAETRLQYVNGVWTWNVGTVPAGQTVTLNYRIQLTDEVNQKDVRIYNDAGVWYGQEFMHSDWEDVSTAAGLKDNNKEITSGYHKDENGNQVISYKVSTTAKPTNLRDLQNVKIHDYVNLEADADKAKAQYYHYTNPKVSVGGVTYTIGQPVGTGDKTWSLTPPNSSSIGNIVEKTNANASRKQDRKYIEFTIPTLAPGQTIEFTYDLIIDNELFTNFGSQASGDKGQEAVNATSLTVKNYADISVNGSVKAYPSTEKTITKGWIKKNGVKKEPGFWEFTLKVNEPKKGEPSVVTSSSVNNIKDMLGPGWQYCDENKAGDGTKTKVYITKYPINSDGESYNKNDPKTETKEVTITQLTDSKYATSWSFQDTGAYYYEVKYYAKRVDSRVSDDMGNGAGYGIGPGLDPFIHEAYWEGEDHSGKALTKEAKGFNADNTVASWEVRVNHNVYNGWTLTDKPLEGTTDEETGETTGASKGFTIKPETLKVERLNGQNIDSSKYTVSYDTKTYVITFNADIPASDSNPIVVKYDTDLDAKDIEDAAKGEELTYKNKAILSGGTSNEVEAEAEQSFTKSDYISKRCDGISNGIITWSVTINGTGEMSGDATVYDVIPEGTEYVENSAHITDHGSAAADTMMQLGQPAIQAGKLVMLFNNLHATKQKNASVTVELKTKIVDPNFTQENVAEGDCVYKNEAQLVYGGKTRKAFAEAKPTNTVLTKNGNLDAGHLFDYVITINEDAVDINPDGDTVKLIDEHSSNMMIQTETIQVKKNGVKLDPQPKVEIDGNTLTMEIPDNQKLTLEYTCYIFGKEGESTPISNTVKFEGSKTVTHGPTSVVINKGSGGISGVPSVKVKKLDGSDIKKTIGGAKFQLYSVTAQDGKLVATKSGEPKATGANGLATFDVEWDEVFALQEVETMPGFVLDDSMIYFYIEKNGISDELKAAAEAQGVTLKQVEKHFTFERFNQPRTLNVSKVDFSKAGVEIKGAHIKVLNPDGSVFDEWDTDGKIHQVQYLLADTLYTIIETKAPEEFDKIHDITFELDKDGNLKTDKGSVNTEKVTSEIKDDNTVILKDMPLTKINIEKIWDDAEFKKLEDKGYNRPDKITYNLYGAISDNTQVYPADGTKATQDGLKANNWKAEFTNLPKYDEATGEEITYYVYESDLDGYASSNYSRNPAVVSGDKVTITNTPEEGDEDFAPLDITIHKIDTTTKENLAGATFTIKKDGKTVGTTQSTDEAKGETTFTFVEPGTYTITEAQAPDGYLLGTDEYTVEVTKGGVKEVVKRENTEGKNVFVKIFNLLFGKNELIPFVNGVLTVEDTPRSFSISKVDFENTDVELAGAHIQVLNPDGSVFDEWDTGRVHTVKGLESDVLYTITETEVPEGHIAINDITFELDKDGNLKTDKGTVNTETVTSEVKGGKIVLKDIPLTKVDVKKTWKDGNIAGKKGYTRPEINFNLVGTVGEDTVYAKATKTGTEENNWTVTFDELPKYDLETGQKVTYKVYEDEASGYESSNLENNPVDATAAGYKAEITNTPNEDEDYLPIDLHILKTDSTDKTKKLAGAKFKVTDEAGQQIEEVKATDENGNTSFTFTKPGTYTVTEVEAPDGYLLGDDKYVVTVEKNGIVEVKKSEDNIFIKIYDLLFGKNDLDNFKDGVLTVPNEPTDVEVLKVDEDDNTLVLTGAHLTVLDEKGNEIDSWVSGQTPHHVKNLEIGKTYYLKETVAPEGYALTTITKFVVGEDGKIIKDPEKTTEGTVNAKGQLLNIDPMIAENAGIKVTKHLKASNGDSVGAVDKTFYVALFSDEDLTDRVSDIKALHYKNSSSETVEFKEVSANRDYYIAEVDASGNPLTTFQPIEYAEGGTVKNGYIMDFGDGEVKKKVTTEDGETLVYFENEFWNVPDDFYKDGSIEITKKVTDTKGNPVNVTGSFYVSAFKDAECTQLAYGPVEIKLNEESEAKAKIEEMALGKYYLAETDEFGTVVDDTFDYVPVFSTREVEVTEEVTEFEVTLVNKQPVDSFELIKLVKNSKGKDKKVTGSFYVSVYSDPECTQIVKIVEISLEKASKGTVTVGGLAPGTYYLAETDELGNKVGKKFNYVPKFDRNTIEIVRADLCDDVTLTNKEKPGKPKTGDEAMLSLGLLLMALSALGGTLAARRRKETK